MGLGGSRDEATPPGREEEQLEAVRIACFFLG
jgi:hypothetical protein